MKYLDLIATDYGDVNISPREACIWQRGFDPETAYAACPGYGQYVPYRVVAEQIMHDAQKVAKYRSGAQIK